MLIVENVSVFHRVYTLFSGIYFHLDFLQYRSSGWRKESSNDVQLWEGLCLTGLFDGCLGN